MRRSVARPDEFLIALGEVIHERRIHLGRSQQELADLAGVHRTYISDIERGARNLTVTTVSRLAEALDVTPSRLFRLADDKLDVLVAAGNH
ncbi:MAG TPA: helix-turn-helix transcriptional regulator [Planktothrix sp.]|jgi:transcriptional regulator with XRE-family HTH domain